jgi:hypothetical protein
VKLGKLNARPDHLSRILSGEDARNIDDNFMDAQLFFVKMVDDYFANIVQFLSTGIAPLDMIVAHKGQLVVKTIDYHLIAGNLYNLGRYGILR